MPIKVRKSISNLQTYNVGGRSDLSSDWECFDWNESEFPPTNKVFEVMKSFYRYERYPDITAKQLKNKLSEYVSLPVDFIEVYNGSDDALKDIITVFVDKDTKVLSYQPSYTQVNTFITTNTENYMKKLIFKIHWVNMNMTLIIVNLMMLFILSIQIIQQENYYQ